MGDYTGDVEAAIEGDATTIAFNARYLNDVLGNVRRPVRARAQRPALAGRVPAGRRRRLRPRRDARPDDVLTGALGAPPRTRRRAPSRSTSSARAPHPSCSGCRSATCAATPRSTPCSRRARSSCGARTPPARPACSRRSSSRRGAAPIARPPTASSSAGARSWPASRRGSGEPATEPRARDAVEVALVRTASRRRPQADPGQRRRPSGGGARRRAPDRDVRPRGDAAGRGLAVAAPRGARPPGRPAIARLPPGPRDLRPRPPAAQRPAAARSARSRRRAPSCGSGTGRCSRPAARCVPSGSASWSPRGPAGGRARRDRARRGRRGPARASPTRRTPRSCPASRCATPSPGGSRRRPRRRSGTAPR